MNQSDAVAQRGDALGRVLIDRRRVRHVVQHIDQPVIPGIQERLVDDKGEVRRFVNVYVNEEDIRFLQNKATPLKDGDEISIIPAIAGG